MQVSASSDIVRNHCYSEENVHFARLSTVQAPPLFTLLVHAPVDGEAAQQTHSHRPMKRRIPKNSFLIFNTTTQ